jgi:hypothetical protein
MISHSENDSELRELGSKLDRLEEAMRRSSIESRGLSRDNNNIQSLENEVAR